MFVPQEALAVGHLSNKMCWMGVEKKRLRISSNSNDARLASGTKFQSRDQVIDKVSTFK